MKIYKYIILLITLLLLFSCKSRNEAIENDEVTEWLEFEGKKGMPHVVLVSGDEEYRSEEAMPQLAKMLSEHHGYNCTVLFAQDPAKPGYVNANYVFNIPGLEQLATADMMVIFTRFRALPDDQMVHIDNFLKSGKPVLGMRTSTHAFKFKDMDVNTSYAHYGNYYRGDDEWKEGFGRLVLGENWRYHHGHHAHQSTRGIAAPESDGHPMLNGIEEGDIWGPTDVYGVRFPLPGDGQAVVLGAVVGRPGEQEPADPRLGMRPTDDIVPDNVTRKNKEGKEVSVDLNSPMMPIVWTKSYQIPNGKIGRAIATTIGSSTDMLSEGVRRLLVNAVVWGLDRQVPEKAKVDIVGSYEPLRFAFQKEGYWEDRNLKISELK
ncbi:MAG: hypothetical protein ACI9FN_000187 [Saprospiraceae bacterium]|jgi:hypothetical protein